MGGSRIVIQKVLDATIATINDTSVIDPQRIEDMRKTLFDLIDKQDRRKLILDISKVKHLSSAALGVLIPLQEKYNAAKGKLVIVGVCDGIMKLFTITGLNKLLSFADDESEAMSILGVER
ncbi:MAG: STAS domain-containing protein [Phycisphaerae bacterium]